MGYEWINDLAVQVLDAIESRRCVAELVRVRLRACNGVCQRITNLLEKMKPLDKLLAIFKGNYGALRIGAITDLAGLGKNEPGTLDLEKVKKAIEKAPGLICPENF